MKKLTLICVSALFIWACSSDSGSADGGTSPEDKIGKTPAAVADDGKGVGETKHVELNNPLNDEMAKKGTAIYEMKCSACHKLTAQRVVGPGWKGVTERRKPEWIMNMTTNVDMMLEQDPAAQAMLKECLVRMPNQNLSVGDARDVLEFMYANDAAPAPGK